MKKTKPYLIMTTLLTAALLVSACKDEAKTTSASSTKALKAGATAKAPSQKVIAASKGVAKDKAGAKKVKKIVFVGKKDACDCTRKRVDASFAALNAALGEGGATIPIERLQVDVDPIAVGEYKKLSPIVVLPAIYLLEGSGKLVKVLHGEVTAEQVKKAIGA